MELSTPSRFDVRQAMAGDAMTKRFRSVAIMFFAAFCCLVGSVRPALAQSVITYHNAADRSGTYKVPGLTFAAAAKLHLDAAFHATISGNVYAQPLYWRPAGAKAGLLIVATESNLVYALNAGTGAQVWKTQVGTPVQSGTLPCGDIAPEGVTGTPVIDPASGRLYLDAMTIQPGNLPRHMIYALSLADGKVVPHWPLNVDNALAARHVSFSSEIEGERSALQFLGGKLYVNFAGRAGDCGNYHGAVIEITPSAVPKISGDWMTRAVRGGIWSQGGVTSDGTSLFATTGNTSGANSWGDGEAVIRLLPGLARSSKVKDYFTPLDWKTLDNEDADLGSTAAVPFNVSTSSGTVSRLIGLGKDGHAYLLNTSYLGGIGHAVANVQVSNARIVTAPAIYEGPSHTLVAFTNPAGLSAKCSGSSVTMLKVTGGTSTAISTAWCAPLNGNAEPIITTTNGVANPIVWVTGAEGDNEIHGFDVFSGKVVFSGANTGMTGLRHFSTLIAADGRLYVGADNTVYAFAF
jgi:outer membrane protein assembly factor BamB